jgi:hypothetical protein
MLSGLSFGPLYCYALMAVQIGLLLALAQPTTPIRAVGSRVPTTSGLALDI